MAFVLDELVAVDPVAAGQQQFLDELTALVGGFGARVADGADVDGDGFRGRVTVFVDGHRVSSLARD